MPPSGFLISWARLRISSLLACAWSSSALLAVLPRLLLDLAASRRRTRAGRSVWLTITCTGSGLAMAPGAAARRHRAQRGELVARRRRATRSAATCGSANQSESCEPLDACGAKAEQRPRAPSWRTGTRPSGVTTATIVASRSSAAKRGRQGGAGRGVSRSSADGSLAQLALDARRCRSPCGRSSAFISADAIEVLLVVLLAALPLGLAVVVFLVQRRLALLGLPSSASRMRRASLSRALLLVGVDALAPAGRGVRRRGA